MVIERFADPIVSLLSDAFRKRESVHLRSAITGKIGSPVTIRRPLLVVLKTAPLVYGEVEDTLSKVTVAKAVVLPLVTAKPTSTVCPMVIVWLVPNSVQVTPSGET